MQQPSWTSRMLRELLSSGIACVPVLVVNDSPSPPRPSFAARFRTISRTALFELYRRLDARLTDLEHDPFRLVDVSGDLAGADVIRVRPSMTRHCDYFQPPDVARLRSYSLDVAIRLGFRILRGDVLQIPRYGIWSYHHGDNRVNRGGPPAVWEVLERHEVTGVTLQVLTEELDSGRILARCHVATDTVSFRRNAANAYWAAASLVVRKLRELHECGERALASAEASSFEPYSRRLYVTPTNREMVRLLPRVLRRHVGATAGARESSTRWFIGWKLTSGSRHAPGVPNETFYNFRRLIPPRECSWRAPFAARHEDRHVVLLEEHVHGDRRSRIAATVLGDDGQVRPVEPVLERPYGLHRPALFRWRGETYLMVGLGSEGGVEVYRSISFPGQWEQVPAPLPCEDLVAATLSEIDGQWWLWGTRPIPECPTCDDLFVYFARTPFGPWQPHVCNPVKTDVRGSRPAGQPFHLAGHWYRPAQDSSRRHGAGIRVHRIERLTASDFAEVEVARIEPRWYPGLIAMQTLNAAERLTVIDGATRGPHRP